MFSILGVSSCIYYKFDRDYYFNLIKEDNTEQNGRFSVHRTKACSKQLNKTQNELDACKIYLMNGYNQTEIDSSSYCKLPGKHWHELV